MRGLPEALQQFFKGKRVVVTGHTGFKGSWLALWLQKHGASVFGIALPPTSPLSIFGACALEKRVTSVSLDIRDFGTLSGALDRFKPEIVFHLAAQAIVGTSFEDPRTTFETNVLGTVNVLESLRLIRSARVVVMITSDKCYENVEQTSGYREHDRLGGDDPYSASKACAEHVIRAYARSFFGDSSGTAIASARTGNVVGGGDWSRYRLIPDCIRSLRKGEKITLRNPEATRPWQFVLDPLAGYQQLAMRLWSDGEAFAGPWNFGPIVDNTNTVERCAREIVRSWGSGDIEIVRSSRFKEHALLQLDCAKAGELLGWRPMADFHTTMGLTADWYKRQYALGDSTMLEESYAQIERFEQWMGGEDGT